MGKPIFSASGRCRPAECPTCGSNLDTFSNFNDGTKPNKPRAGDMTICAHCYSVLIFTANLNLRDVTPHEMKRFMANPIVAELLKATREFAATKSKGQSLPAIERLDVWKKF